MNATLSWQQFVLHGETDKDIRKEILDSWRMCKQLGISHELDQVVSHISNNEFAKRREKNEDLLSAAAPVMRELYSCLKGGGYLLLLADADGYLIEMMADAKAQRICDPGGIYPGARWMEDSVGSTGLSIALRTRTAMATSAMEHYCTAFRVWDCSACPIFVDGEFVGVFDVCRVGPGNDIRELYTLAISGARAIAERMHYEKNRIETEVLSQILIHSGDINLQSTGILSFDKWGRMIYKNKSAFQFIQLLQQEHFSNRRNEHSIFNYLKNQVKEKNEEIVLKGKRYLIESKLLTKWNQDIATIILIKPEVNKQTFYSTAKNTHQDQSHIHNTFQTKNTVFNKTLNRIVKISKSNASVLLKGESGTGKDFMARAIHQESSRYNKPFIALNCASLPKELIASELFGYAPGAFTGANKKGNIGKIEAANGGTLFLDEIADMPLDLQAILLRTLEEKQLTRIGSTIPVPVDVRFIAASHKSLPLLVEKGEFREDLFYRLNVFTVQLPPLRERPEDLESLINSMISSSCKEAHRKIITFTPQAIELLKSYQWPGNLRELRNFIERITYLHDQDQIDTLQIQDFLDVDETSIFSLNEREQIQLALRKTKGNRAQAAKELNISRSALYRKLEKYSM
ncbi:sigma-54-dependent Fis family transcriptional regulator [Domibacillus iocasae]|uniref:Sigma-54 factor interaction domain-containing protein n=1 Tax=Domibacillus iocasae TaxID=1714016 RepID=A0A1E7DSP1_9BACI|nr:sigma-54-dependent Fis family transcriptional regulator [Domibacillus iocasae]OES46096.1 hypothetical protein BA724_16040 [Domibacillus iocasae]